VVALDRFKAVAINVLLPIGSSTVFVAIGEQQKHSVTFSVKVSVCDFILIMFYV
jgi:arginine exporter protein ArgO